MKYKIFETFKEIIGDDPVTIIHATVAPLSMCMPWKFGRDPIYTLCVSKERDTYFALNERVYFGTAIDMFRSYYEGNTSIDELREKYLVYERGTQQLYREIINKDISLLSDDELRDYIHRCNDLYFELIHTLYIETIDYDMILSVIGIAMKEKLDAIWEKATESTFVSFEGRYLRNMVEIVSSRDGNEVREAKFMFTDYFETKSEEDISEALDNIRKKLNEKRTEADKLYVDARNRKNSFVEWFGKLDQDSRRITEYVQLVMSLRDVRKDPIAQLLTILTEVATFMTERAGIESRYTPYVILYEYIQGVEYLKKIKDDIRTRDKGAIYIANPDRTYAVEHCDFQEVVAQLNEWTRRHEHDSDEIKGQTACRGQVRGIVRVVSDPHDDRGFQDGDILVTSMTRPEFVPIMKKAGAVVTNEGGITCHAAIISRELKIPCIIGTKIATKAFKDGDLVEVDADSGVVRIIERKK